MAESGSKSHWTIRPSTMALVRGMFRDAGERARAIGIWSGVMTGGIALGSVLSGLLVEHFWWGPVFLVNPPAMVLLLVLAPVLLPESRSSVKERFDLVSVPLSLAAVLPLVYGLKGIPSQGFDARYVVALAVGVVFAVLFVHRQRTAAAPLVSPRALRGRGFGPAVVLGLVASFAMMGSALFTTQYLQSVLGKSAIEAALWALVPSVLVGAAAPAATALVQRGVSRSTVMAGGIPSGGGPCWASSGGACTVQHTLHSGCGFPARRLRDRRGRPRPAGAGRHPRALWTVLAGAASSPAASRR